MNCGIWLYLTTKWKIKGWISIFSWTMKVWNLEYLKRPSSSHLSRGKWLLASLRFGQIWKKNCNWVVEILMSESERMWSDYALSLDNYRYYYQTILSKNYILIYYIWRSNDARAPSLDTTKFLRGPPINK